MFVLVGTVLWGKFLSSRIYDSSLLIKICFIFIRKGWTVSFQYLCSLLLDLVKENGLLPACKVSIIIFCCL